MWLTAVLLLAICYCLEEVCNDISTGQSEAAAFLRANHSHASLGQLKAGAANDEAMATRQNELVFYYLTHPSEEIGG